jgi:hypothetical protein
VARLLLSALAPTPALQLHERPAAPQVEIDNRLGAADPLDAQIARLLAHLGTS